MKVTVRKYVVSSFHVMEPLKKTAYFLIILEILTNLPHQKLEFEDSGSLYDTQTSEPKDFKVSQT